MSLKCHSYSRASVPFSHIHDTPYCNMSKPQKEWIVPVRVFGDQVDVWGKMFSLSQAPLH